MGLDTIVGVIFPVLTVVIGGACILLFSVTTTLRASNSDLRERVKDLEAKNLTNEATISAQKVEIELWSKTVTGEVHLVAIEDLLTHHNNYAVKLGDSLTKCMAHLDGSIEDLDDLMKELLLLMKKDRA